MEKRYMISDAAKLVDVEAHVLRYWEEELEIEIPRNEMGHRYYTDKLIELFREIKELKDQGFLLKAIKLLLPELTEGKSITPSDVMHQSDTSHEVAEDRSGDIIMTTEAQPENVDKLNKNKMEQFQLILGNIVSKALEENNSCLGKSVSEQVSENVIKQMDYLLRMKEEQEEERFRKLDETIRNYQNLGKDQAVHNKRRRISLFSSKK